VLDQFSRDKHKLSVIFIALSKLRRILGGIHYRIMGVAGNGAIIVEVIDNGSGATNEQLTPNDVITILGRMLKIAGAPALTGIYFVAPGSPQITVKVVVRLVENNPPQDHRHGTGPPCGQEMEGADPHAVFRRRSPAERSPHHQDRLPALHPAPQGPPVGAA
jgi:hypothetical protein